MTTSAGEIVAHVVHARAVPARAREQFAASLRSEQGTDGLLLETCHRVEYYATEPGRPSRGPAAPALPVGGTVLRGPAAIRHVMAVAVGRDSVVIGEDQVLHQLRQAIGRARARGGLDPVLDRLFGVALRAGRRARSWRQAPSRSLADIAVERIARESNGVAGRRVLIVGSGEMGRLAADAALAAGASVSLASRSSERAAIVAQALGARVDDFDPGARVREFVGIVVALRGPWAIASSTVTALSQARIPIVDLSVPASVPERLVLSLGERLTTADDLARDDGEAHPTSERMLARLDALVDRTATEFLTWLGGRERRAAASALVERADAEREAELAELWRRLPNLDAGARATIEGMSRHLAERLLREPLERLGADEDGRHERAVRDLWAL